MFVSFLLRQSGVFLRFGTSGGTLSIQNVSTCKKQRSLLWSPSRAARSPAVRCGKRAAFLLRTAGMITSPVAAWGWIGSACLFHRTCSITTMPLSSVIFGPTQKHARAHHCTQDHRKQRTLLCKG